MLVRRFFDPLTFVYVLIYKVTVGDDGGIWVRVAIIFGEERAKRLNNQGSQWEL